MPDVAQLQLINSRLQDENKRLAEELERVASREQQFRTVADLTSDYCYTARLRAGRVESQWINGSFVEITGFEANAVEGLRFDEIAHPDDRAEVRKLLEDLLRTPGTCDHEFRLVTRSGEERTIREKLRVVRQDDDVLYVFGAAQDVTEPRRAQAVAQESERRLAAIGTASADMIAEVGPDGRVAYVTPNCEAVVGYRPDEFVGMTVPQIASLLQASFSESVAGAADLAELVARGPFDDLRTIRDKAGNLRWVETVAHHYLTTEGELRAVSISRDVTERLRVESEMRQHQKVESLGLLAGGIAHDFNNLLTGVRANAELALEDVAPGSPGRTAIEALVHASARASQLTEQMLAYAGKAHFEMRAVDLSQCVEKTAGLLQGALASRVALRLELEPGLPLLEADLAQLQQVVTNLLLNAAEACGTERGIVRATTRMATESEITGRPAVGRFVGTRYVCLEVRDDGCGMDAETRTRIFDPFYSTKGTGRGLGLAAVMGIVRAHNGAMEVSSTVGEGTVLKLFFPNAEQSIRRSSQRGAAFAGLGVLVVDDEPVVSDAARRILERLGCAVLTADSGAAALDILAARTDSIAVVFLDATMPELSGADTLARIRTIAPGTPVVLMSGFLEDAVKRDMPGNGIAEFVQKPFGPDSLKGALARLFGGQA